MQTIVIQQQSTTERGFEAIVTIGGSTFEVRVRDPFAEAEEREMEWYFEQWIQFPFTDTTIAERAAGKVRWYGEALFEQVFSGRAYGAYQRVNESLSELEIVVKGDPAFQSLHWEAMWDRDFDRPLAVDAVMVRERKIAGMVNSARIQPSAVLNLLIVTARPNEESDVGYRTISRPMVEAIENAKLRVNVEIVRPGTFEAFVRHVEGNPEGFYHVVHFDLHGGLMTYAQSQSYGRGAGSYTFQRSYGLGDLERYEGVKAFLFFEGEEKGQAVPVTAKEMAGRLQGRGIPVCILNACQSGKQVGENCAGIDDRETSLGARLMDAGMQMVVAMGYGVTVDAAKVLMERVYQSLFAGSAMAKAVRSGRRELFDNKKRRVYFNQVVDLEDWLLPVVYGNQAVDFRLREMTFAEEEEYYAGLELEYRFAGASYGFVGRDLDILKLEKGLLKSGVVLVQGMGGTGKTTLFRYLQEWWVRTRFVDRIFYFGYDVKAWTLEQMVFEIGSQVFEGAAMRQFQAMGIAAQVGKLVTVLRSGRFGLMLDNLESVTGQALAIQNTLSEGEQGKVRSFLEKVVGGKSWVVLGSRGQEPWLKSVYGESRYELRGLDGQARSELAKLVLERHIADGGQRRSILADPEFARLMKVLAGYPLAIEVVLSNLRQQSVAEVLRGLDLGDVNLDRDGARTESILQCVEYSHGNLSAEAQKLLLLLAPFSGVVFRDFLQDYTAELQKFKAFRDYPFEQFDAAVQEAIDWGLLSPMEESPRFLMIQPVFPYFLKTKLAEQDEETREALRDGFKNHYLGLASSCNQLMNSKDSQEKQLGIFLCKLEYENLYRALQICLERQESILIFVCLNKYFELIGDPESALKLAEEVYQAVEQYPDKWKTDVDSKEYQGVLNLVSYCYLQTKHYAEARVVSQKKLKIEEIKGDRDSEASTYHNLGIVAQELREYGEAQDKYQQALQIKVELNNDRYSQVSTYQQLGMVFQKLREYGKAQAKYQQALDIYDEYKDRYSQANIYHNLGMVFQELQKYGKAQAKYQQALDIYDEYKDFHSQARTYNQLGTVALELREYEEARVNYQKALKIKIEYNDRYSQASTYHQLGMVAEELREYEEARVNYQQALQIKVEYNDRYSQANTYGQLGLLAEAEGNPAEAINFLRKALEIFTEFEDEHYMGISRRDLERMVRGKDEG